MSASDGGPSAKTHTIEIEIAGHDVSVEIVGGDGSEMLLAHVADALADIENEWGDGDG